MQNLTSLIVVALFSISTLFGQTTLDDCFHSIQSADPSSSYDDLRFLDTPLERVKVVSMGESTHGTSEFTVMRLKMFKYLVKEHGFNTLFLEDEFSRCLRVDDFIKGKADEAKTVVLNLSHWPWITQEILDIVVWMREYNQIHPENQLSFVGVDMQDGRHVLKTFNELCKKYQSKDTITLLPKVKAKTEKEFIAAKQRQFNDSLLQRCATIVSNLSLNDQDRQFSDQLLHVLAQNKKYLDNQKAHAYRDFCMGDNILDYLATHPNAKGMFVAHNAHIAEVIKRKKNWKKSWGYAGGVLSENLGEAYFSIAQDFDYGSFMARAKEEATADGELPSYPLKEVYVKESTKGTVGELVRSQKDSIVYFSLGDYGKVPNKKGKTKKDKYLINHNIGAVFYPAKKDAEQTSQFIGFSDKNYDAFILFKRSNPTRLLKKSEPKKTANP